MLLPKITASRPYRLYKTYAPWLAFNAIILILTNAFGSLDEIRAYNFRVVDTVLTYGFLAFWNIIEAAVITALLVLVQIGLEKGLRKPLDRFFRMGVVVLTLACWVIVFLAIFHLV